jgi:membrane protease YdiL (CAAX protease family)
VLRLILGVFVCIYGGSLAGCVLHYWQAGGKASGRVFYPLAAAAVVCLGATLVLLRRPLRLERMLPRLVAILGCFYAGLLLGLWVEKYGASEDLSVGQMVVGTVSSHGAGLLLVWCFLREHETGWGEAFGLGNGSRDALVLGLVAAALFVPVGWGVEQASAWGLSHLAPAAMKPEEQRAVQVLRTAVSWSQRGLLGAITIALAPVAEEVFFRGILYTAVKQAGFRRLALWGTAALFAFIHFNLLTFLPLMALALVLTILYERTQNLLAPIAAHSFFNALNFALLYCFSKP